MEGKPAPADLLTEAIRRNPQNQRREQADIPQIVNLAE
jgi:hypothetical protein